MAGEGPAKAKRDAKERQAANNRSADMPIVPEQPSERRHTAYWLTVVAGGLLLNLLVMYVLAGG